MPRTTTPRSKPSKLLRHRGFKHGDHGRNYASITEHESAQACASLPALEDLDHDLYHDLEGHVDDTEPLYFVSREDERTADVAAQIDHIPNHSTLSALRDNDFRAFRRALQRHGRTTPSDAWTNQSTDELATATSSQAASRRSSLASTTQPSVAPSTAPTSVNEKPVDRSDSDSDNIGTNTVDDLVRTNNPVTSARFSSADEAAHRAMATDKLGAFLPCAAAMPRPLVCALSGRPGWIALRRRDLSR